MGKINLDPEMSCSADNRVILRTPSVCAKQTDTINNNYYTVENDCYYVYITDDNLLVN